MQTVGQKNKRRDMGPAAHVSLVFLFKAIIYGGPT